MSSSAPTHDKCPQLENYFLAIAFLPYWFRLAQCFRRYHDCKLKIHLANAGKYFCVMLIQLANIFKHKIKGETSLTVFIVISIVSSCYNYGWDLYMDWGLLRSNKPGERFLRPKIMLPQWFYYYAIVSNLVMRFVWILALYSANMPIWV